MNCTVLRWAQVFAASQTFKQDNTMNMYRVAGLALAAGLALFLLSVLIKLLLVTFAAVLVVRVVGGYIWSRTAGSLGRGGWQSTNVIAIDNPAYRSPMSRVSVDRVIPIG
ncbi:hypothetical protein GCM10027577_51510 [Spirosoma fluminis]